MRTISYHDVGSRISFVSTGDAMSNEAVVEILKRHLEPVPREESYRESTESRIRYLKNIGLLDCFYDYSKDMDMIYTTEHGKRFIVLNDCNASLDKLRDIIEEGDLSSERYREAVADAVRASPY